MRIKMENRNDILLLTLSILLGISVLKLTEVFQLCEQVKTILFVGDNHGFSLITIGVYTFISGYILFFILAAITSIGVTHHLLLNLKSSANLTQLLGYCIICLTISYLAVFSIAINGIIKIDNLVEVPIFCKDDCYNNPPSIPIIYYPKFGDYSYKLIWSNSTDKDTVDKITYILEICDQPTFKSSRIYNIRSINDTSYQLINFFKKFKADSTLKYFWRVASDDGYYQSNYSSNGEFRYNTTRY